MSDDAATPDLRYGRTIRRVLETPWAITADMLATICEVLALRSQGRSFTRAELQARVGGPAGDTGTTVVRVKAGTVAVLPLHGVIVPRADLLDEVSGMVPLEKFRLRFREALADESVGSVVLNIDSPGGTVDLVPETAAEILAARGVKRVTAVANSLAASAAYWLASAADEIVVTPSGEIGSIGIYSAHQDFSKQLEALGVKVTLVSAGRFKIEGNPFEPLSDEARAAIQARVDEYYGMFVDSVARGRDVASAAVRGGFGEGRIVGAKEAVSLGMADRVATLEDTIRRLQGGRSPRRNSARHPHDFTFV